MKLGYLRVSTEEQKPDRQIDALESQCDQLFIEKLSAVAAKRPVFEHVIKILKRGDTLVVWDLDRACRSTLDALQLSQELQTKGVEFRIVSMDIDTSEPMGQFFFTVAAAFAQLERQTISKRTKEGLEAAKKRGTVLGRRPKLSARQVRQAKSMLSSKTHALSEIAALLNVHPRTISRALRK